MARISEHGPDHQGPGPDDPAHQAAAAAGEQLGQPVLYVVLDVELAQLRVAVLQIVQVVRDLVGERGGLAGHRRDGRGQEACHDADAADDDDHDGRPPGHAVADQPAHDRIETGRDKERQADEDEHGPSVDEQLDQAVGDRDPEGGVQPDHERRTPVDRTSELAQAAGLLRDLGRLLHGLLDRFISGAAVCPGFFVLGSDFFLRPDLSRLRGLAGVAHAAATTRSWAIQAPWAWLPQGSLGVTRPVS